MATRVVERQLEWCETIIVEFLAQNGYTVVIAKDQERKLQANYTISDKQKMLVRPRVQVTLTPLSGSETRVCVGFKLRGLICLSLWLIWSLVGILPGFAMMCIAMQAGKWALGLHPFLAILAWLLACVWASYCLAWRLALPNCAMERHIDRTETLLWEHLDPKDLYSHEIDSVSPTWRAVFSFCKWVSFCLMIMGVGMLKDSPSGGAYMLLIGGAVLFVTIGWVTCSLALPHRFHWKVGFYENYLCWWVIVSAPCMMIPCYGMDPDLLSGFCCQDAVMGITFCLQALMLQAGLRMLPEFRDEEKARIFYSPPSARYEALSEQDIAGDIRWLLKKHRLWTWATFILFTVLFYSAALYLVTVLVLRPRNKVY